MELHHPPPRACRARLSLGRRRVRALVLVACLLATACSASEDRAQELPDELVAADGETVGDGSSSKGPGGLDGFDPVEEPEGDPTEPPAPGTVELTAEPPSAVIDDVAEQLAANHDGDELLDAVEPVDRAEATVVDDDGRPRNGLGELLVLDGEASLACAQIEIAIGLFDGGQSGQAADWVSSGADQALSSAVADIHSWADPLRTAVRGAEIADPAPLVGFLSVCTEGGYEL